MNHRNSVIAKSIKVFSILILFSCSVRNDSPLDVSVEQKALNFLMDSLIYKNISCNREVVLVPLDFKEEWIDKSLFLNTKIYSDFRIDSLSEPYHDVITLQNYSKVMDDSTLQEAKSFMKFYKSNKASRFTQELRQDEIIQFNSFYCFEQRNRPNELFVRVMKRIVGAKSQMVRIKFIGRKENPEHKFSFSLLVFYDIQGNLTHWIFQ